MNRSHIKFAAAAAMACAMALPATSSANYQSAMKHRQQTKNTWRNLGYGAAALGVYGLLTHNSTMTWLGAGGAAYSAYRYEGDRRSQNTIKERHSYLRHHARRRHRR